MSRNKIKGAIIVNYVRMIRASKDLPWGEYLTKEDMELVHGNIMPSTWYPLEVFEHVGYAVFMLMGKGDLNVARAFGALSVQETFSRVYQKVLFQEKDMVSVLKKFVVLRKQFIRFEDPDFDSMSMELIEDNKVKMILKAPEFNKYIKPYTHQVAGAFEKLLEMSDAKDIRVNIVSIQSETEPGSEIEITWSGMAEKKE